MKEYKEYKVIIGRNVLKEERYYENGQKKYEAYYLNDKFHRENGPARQEWYKNGQKKYESYSINGNFHRENVPAVQEWYKNGQKGYEAYCLNGKLFCESFLPKYGNFYKIIYDLVKNDF